MSTADGLRDWAKQCGINGHTAEQKILDAAADELEQRMPTPAVRGPCAKRQVVCELRWIAEDGLPGRAIGKNDCANPQPVCPRLPGEGYEKCQTICQQAGHAEIEAIKAAGPCAKGSHAHLDGHYWICEPCGRALLEAGVASVRISLNERRK